MLEPQERTTSHARSNSALLIVDLVSDFSFKDGEKLFPQALAAAENVSRLKQRAKMSGAPVIYVNDNCGRWNDDFKGYTESVRENSEMGRAILELIELQAGDHFILKPQRSGFYATALGVLLLSMNVSNVVVTGVTTDICVLFTAHDAYMRGYHVFVPVDCTGAVEERHHKQALDLMARVAEADTRESSEVVFSANNTPKDEFASRNGPLDIGSNGDLLVGKLL